MYNTAAIHISNTSIEVLLGIYRNDNCRQSLYKSICTVPLPATYKEATGMRSMTISSIYIDMLVLSM